MCPDDSTPDPKPPAHHQTVPIRPAAVLDPYPEHVTSFRGVRLYTAPAATRTRMSTTRVAGSGRRRPFGASVLITVAAQGALTASIAANTVAPILGAVAAVALMVCGLGLILAEMMQAASR